MEDQHYLISPYKNLRFIRFRIHVKQKFTILVTTQKSETIHTAKVCILCCLCANRSCVPSQGRFLYGKINTQALVYTPKPKYQFYPRGNIKETRDLRRGCFFRDPPSPVNVRFYAAGTPFSASGMVFLIFRYRLSGSALII